MVYSALDPEAPATQSPAVVRLMREEIGFGGLLMTDDLSMKALGGGFAERAARALAAGCDVVLHCNGDPGEMARGGRRRRRSWPGSPRRARRRRWRCGGCEPADDAAALAAEFAALRERAHA